MRYFLILLSLSIVTSVSAQTKKERFKAVLDSVLLTKYLKVNYDTNYIGRPEGSKFTIKTRVNVSGTNLKAKGNGIEADLKTKEKVTLSVGLSYRGLSAGLAINPYSMSGRSKDYELNLNFYNNRYSIDASYQMAKTLAGTINDTGTDLQLEEGWVNMKVLNIAGYYTFNYRRFSYPAAFSQSYIQKRSAGSWLAGFSYQGGSIKNSGDAPSHIPQTRFYVGHFGIGGGYGYNLVTGGWLIHLSALPTIILLTRDNVTINGERQYSDTKFPTVMLNGRIAIIRNIGQRQFVGMTGVGNHLLKNNKGTNFLQSKWRLRVFYGIRL